MAYASRNIVQKLIGLRPRQIEALDRICQAQGLTRSMIVREAIDLWLDGPDEEKYERARRDQAITRHS